MDFLSDLLSKQQKPPPANEARKKALLDAQKLKAARQKYIATFREEAVRAVEDFTRDTTRLKMKFKPADKAIRGIVHEIASENSLISHSFGDEGVDRYVYIYKKEYPLSNEELLCYREGRRWNPQQLEVISAVAVEQPAPASMSSSSDSPAPKQHLRKVDSSASLKRKERDLVRASAMDAELVTVSREAFGDVPVAVKQDMRTMNQVFSDIQAKKRLKKEEQESLLTSTAKESEASL